MAPFNGATARLFPAGFEVLCTSVHPSEREQLQAAAQQHGIELVSAVRKDRPPHLVITRSVRSLKYRAVLRTDPDVPAVTPDWLFTCVQRGKRLGYDGFRVGPFLGLRICFSGISAAKKQAMARQVADAGGAHSAALDKKCTHLVTVSTESDKYKFAQREKIVCVQPRWVEECISRGHCLDEGQYQVVDAGREGAGTGSRAASQALKSGVKDLVGDGGGMLCVPAVSGGATLGAGVSDTRMAGGSQPSIGGVSSRQGDGNPLQQQQEQVLANTSAQPSRLQFESGAVPSCAPAAAAGGGGSSNEGRSGADTAAPLIQLSPFQAAEPSYDDLHCDDDSLFLDSCKVHLAGCTPGEQVEMLRIAREGAAKRFADLLPGMTHILVGSDLTPAEASDLVEYAASNRQCTFVSLEWLRQCGAVRERLPPDDRFALPISSLQGVRKRASTLAHLESEPGLRRSMSIALSGDEGGCVTRQSSQMVTGPLEGFHFTLTALRLNEAADDVARVKDLILRNGGRVFDHANSLVVKDKSKACAICPTTLLPSQTAQLRNSFPDFKMVDEKRRYTVYWLECSLLAQQVLPSQRGTPLYHPLPYPLPLVGMNQVLACISGYDPMVRAAIQHTVEVLGGSVTASMTRKNTHLIVSGATGAKYNASHSFGVRAVNADWLLDSIAMGRLQGEAGYPPLPVSEGLAQPAGPHSNMASEERTAGLGAVSQLGATQIGATQFPNAPHPPLPASLYQAAVAGDREAGLAAERPLGAGAAALLKPPSAAPPQQALQQARPGPPARTPGGGSSRGGGLRARMQSQGRAGVRVSSHDENTPAAPNLMDADVATPTWADDPATWRRQQQQLQPPSVLEQQQGGCGEGQVTEQEQPAAVFDQVFGSSSPPAAAQTLNPQPTAPQQPSNQQQQGQGGRQGKGGGTRAAAALAVAPFPSAAAKPAARSAEKAAGGSSGGRSSGKSRRSRLRSDSAAEAFMAVAEAAVADPGAGGGGGASVGRNAQGGAEGKGGWGEEEEGEGSDIERMVDQIGGLLQRVAADQPVLGSQHMPPPPPKSRGSKRPMREGGDDNESVVSLGSKGGEGRSGRSTRAKRSHTLRSSGETPSTSSGPGRNLRRSARGGRAENTEVEMSQQVGYDTSTCVLSTRTAGGGAANSSDAAAKQRLRQIAQRGGARVRDENFLLQMAL